MQRRFTCHEALTKYQGQALGLFLIVEIYIHKILTIKHTFCGEPGKLAQKWWTYAIHFYTNSQNFVRLYFPYFVTLNNQN